ncbi:MAG: ABC transporter permease [Candidatus Acidiferrales bacterium]
MQDLKYALRMLIKSPGFTAVAVLTLALGIGANTAIFSVINGVLLKPLPYPQPDHLVAVFGRFTNIGLPKDQNYFSIPEFADLKELNKSFSDVALVTTDSFNLTGSGRPERATGIDATPNFFALLGLRPVLGRFFIPEEGQAGRDQVVVISSGLWKRRYASDPNIVGRTIEVNAKPMTVVGVLPENFHFLVDADMWKPLAFVPADLAPDNRGNHGYLAFGRIKPELSLAQARADMKTVTKEMIARTANYPYNEYNFEVELVPLLEQTVGDIKLALWVLVGAVGFVLLIACANVANLLLARASAREREMAIRAALGAGAGRLVRQMLTESLLLATLGGIAGVFLAPWALHAIVGLGGVSLPRIADVKIDRWVLAFTAALTILTGVLFGLVPAWQAARRVPIEDLKEGGRSGAGGSSTSGVRKILVAAEAAISVALLVGAGLLLRSFMSVLGVDTGVHAQNVLTMRVSLPDEKYAKREQVTEFYREVLERVRHLPGVKAAGATAVLPLTGIGGSGTTTVDTQAVPADQRTPEADWRPITPGYFEAMNIPLLRGRAFSESDTTTSAAVAIVDDTFAREYWPNEDAVGKRVHLGSQGSMAPWMTIVGVVAHVRYYAFEAPSRVELFWPEAQRPRSGMSLAIQTGQNPLGLAAAVESEISAVDPDQPVYEVRTMDQIKSEWMSQRFLTTLLVGMFAAVALALASVGIFGVMAYFVTRRTQEIGIRMALGAEPRDVMRMIMKQGAGLVAIGLAVGVVVALGLTRLISSLLYGVSAADPITYGSVVVLLMSVAAAACYIPARRAMSVDPLVALRHE